VTRSTFLAGWLDEIALFPFQATSLITTGYQAIISPPSVAFTVLLFALLL
jgi:hypothetical protein